MLGIYAYVFIGLPTLLIMWAALGSSSMAGLPYVIFKGALWQPLVVVPPIFYVMIFAALDERNYPGMWHVWAWC
jgi:hypothetical protein